MLITDVTTVGKRSRKQTISRFTFETYMRISINILVRSARKCLSRRILWLITNHCTTKDKNKLQSLHTILIVHECFCADYDPLLLPGSSANHPSPFQCHLCWKTFKEKTCLKVHIRDIHEEANIRYFCPICNKEFKSINTLRNHKSLYHKGGQK